MKNSSYLKFPYYIFQIAIFSVFATTTAQAQSLGDLKTGDSVQMYYRVPVRDGEYRKAWPPGLEGITCTSISPPNTVPPNHSASMHSHCLRLGPLQLGMQFYQLQMSLAQFSDIEQAGIVKPRDLGATPDGLQTVAIPVVSFRSGEQLRMSSYLVAVFDKQGFVRTLQLTGLAGGAASGLPFSSVTLGTTKEKLVNILGFPSSTSDVPQIRGKLWNYAPFPFSIELKDGVVYSVRLETPNPSDAAKAFTPLQNVID